MMTRNYRNPPLLALAGIAVLLAASLVACGGGSGDTVASSNNQGGGIGGTGVSFGRITGFGSVFVNGHRFDTDAAMIIVNGQDVTQTELTEGMLVRVEGEWTGGEDGVADRIEYSDDILGPVQDPVEFDPLTGEGTMQVLGQTVRFNDLTVFRGIEPAALVAGEYLRISGWRQSNGDYVASLVQSLGDFADGDDARIAGRISDLDTTAMRFAINALDVAYDSGTTIAMFGGRDQLEAGDDGAFVQIDGTFSTAAGLMTAVTLVQREAGNRFGAEPGDDIEFEGPISSIDAAGRTFVIDGVTVRITDDTEFDDGLTEASLATGLRVEVEGEWNDDQEVIAEEIEPRDADAEVEADLLQILDAGNRILDAGGAEVRVTSRTLIVNDDDGDDDSLTFDALLPGDSLEIEGIQQEDEDSNVYLEAIKIERDDDDDDDEFELTARVDSVEAASDRFFVLGVAMNVDGSTEWDDGLNSIDDLAVGQRVEVEYKLRNDGQFYALEVEREDDDGDDADDDDN